MDKDLIRGPVMRSMLLFAIPMILGNLLQQCYNIADILIVGRFLGKNTLAAVGSLFTLMTFLASILLGLCMGSGALFSIRFGQKDKSGLRESVRASFVLIAAALVLNTLFIAQNYGAKEADRINGWLLADVTGAGYYLLRGRQMLYASHSS